LARSSAAPSSAAADLRPALLAVENLSVSYGHINALRSASLVVREGEIVVLIGANGAGKTTLLETVLGINVPASGSVVFAGNDVTALPADRNVRGGLCLVPEGRGVFASMSVIDNLLLGAHHNMANVSKNLPRVFSWFPILEQRKTQVAGTLSGGERQMLAIGRALMSAPRLIMVDEPSIGLAPIVVNDIFSILTMLNREGYTILLSEQNAYKALKCAHRGYVLETGSVAMSGTSAQLLEDPGVRAAYLGA
jgi:branched-chain amino acid transport system ATP-binding protein